MIAAFRATLEEISSSDLLVHVVDVSNPQALQQIDSVEKILRELKLNEIKQIIVLNKSDLADKETIETVSRRISLDNQVPCVAISAIRNETLRPLTEEIGLAIGREMNEPVSATA